MERRTEKKASTQPPRFARPPRHRIRTIGAAKHYKARPSVWRSGEFHNSAASNCRHLPGSSLGQVTLCEHRIVYAPIREPTNQGWIALK